MHSLLRVFIEHTLCIWCLRKCFMWERRNSKSQPSCGGHTSFLTSLFLGLYSNNFHLHSTPVAHFLDFIIYQSQLLNRKPHYHSYGSYLLIYRAVTLNQKKNQCLSESPENFTTLLPVHIYILSLSVSLGLCLSLSRVHTHTHTLPPWKHSLCNFGIFFCSHPHNLRTTDLEKMPSFQMHQLCLCH